MMEGQTESKVCVSPGDHVYDRVRIGNYEDSFVCRKCGHEIPQYEECP